MREKGVDKTQGLDLWSVKGPPSIKIDDTGLFPLMQYHPYESCHSSPSILHVPDEVKVKKKQRRDININKS